MIAPIDKRSSRKIKIEAVEEMCIPEHLIDSVAVRKNAIIYQNIYGHFNDKINICEQITCNGIVLKNNELNNSYSSQNTAGRDERVVNARNGKNKRKLTSNNKVDGENCDEKKKKGI